MVARGQGVILFVPFIITVTFRGRPCAGSLHSSSSSRPLSCRSSSAFSGSKVVLRCPIHASCPAVSATTKSFESSSSSGFVQPGENAVLYVSSARPSSTKSEFSLVVAEYQRRLIAQQCMADQCQTFMLAGRSAPALSKKNSENQLVIRQYPATRQADWFHHRVALPVPELIHVLSTILPRLWYRTKCMHANVPPISLSSGSPPYIVRSFSCHPPTLFSTVMAQEKSFFVWIKLVSITSPRHFLSCSGLVRTAAKLHVLYRRTLSQWPPSTTLRGSSRQGSPP